MVDQHLPLTFRQTTEREGHQTTYRLHALLDGDEVGDLGYQLRSPSRVFIVGVSTRFGWFRRGVASSLLDELCRRELIGGRHLAANSTRENTREGEHLLRSWSAGHGVKIRRIDEGLDGGGR
jgi:hypothetical protein